MTAYLETVYMELFAPLPKSFTINSTDAIPLKSVSISGGEGLFSFVGSPHFCEFNLISSSSGFSDPASAETFCQHSICLPVDVIYGSNSKTFKYILHSSSVANGPLNTL